MDDNFEELVIDIRATTDSFASDIATVGSIVDNSLQGSFERAGNVLERGLMSAIRRGNVGFDDLKRVALNALDEIAAHALQSGIGSLFDGGPSGGVGNILGQSLSGLLGLPGRATGGPVSPGASYLVGERGPEVFVPTSSGRVLAGSQGQSGARDVKVAIQLIAPRGTAAPTAMRRSSRQIASSVRRALQQA